MISSDNVEAMIAFDNLEYTKALDLFSKAIKNDPTHPENYFFLGQSLFQCGEAHQAFTPLKTFIKLKQPGLTDKSKSDDVMNVAHAFDTLGQCYEAENKGKDALICYKTATKISPDCASGWNNMGLYYIKSAGHYLDQELNRQTVAYINKLFLGAQLFLQKALNLFANNAAFLHSMARWYEKYTDVLALIITDEIKAQEQITAYFKSAIESYQQAISACGQNNVTLNKTIETNLAECFAQYGHHIYRSGHYAEAQQMYSETIKLDPDHLNAISQMGMCYFKQENYTEARIRFSRIFGKTTDKQELADAHLNIACAYRFEKNWSMAEESIAKALELSPIDKDILKEQAALAEAKLRAIHVLSPQIMFARTNTVTVPNEGQEPDNQIGNQLGS